MKRKKPQFELTRVSEHDLQETPQILPVASAFDAASLDRRRFLGTGLSATAALLLLNSCEYHKLAAQVEGPTSSLKAHTGGVIVLVVSDDGQTVNSLSDDQTLKRWSVPDGRLLSSEKGKAIGSQNASTADCPDGKMRAVIADNNAINLLSLPTNELLATLHGHTSRINALAITPDCKLLISADKDGVIIVWNLDPPGFRSFLFDPASNHSYAKGASYNSYDRVSGRTVTYTLPCGSPIPANAICTCNCVPGTYELTTTESTSTPTYPPAKTHRVRRHSRAGGSYGESLRRPCTRQPVPAGYVCTCNCVPGT